MSGQSAREVIARALTQGSDYEAWDQEAKLGEPPWSGPALAAWEAAHGHDARLKCYPEYGCRFGSDVDADDILDALSIRGYSVVRLPERAEPMDPTIRATFYCLGWNACLDEIERLSGEVVAE